MTVITDPWFRDLIETIEFDLQLDVLENKLKEQCNKDYNIELFPLYDHPKS